MKGPTSAAAIGLVVCYGMHLPLNRPATLWLQEKQQLISQLDADINNALSRLESCVGQLTLHAVGFYEAKKPSNLSTGRRRHR